MRSNRPLPRSLVLGGAVSAVALLAIALLFLALMKRETGAAPDYRVTHAGGIDYEAMDAHPIDLHNAVDRKLVAGLPASQRRLRRGEILFGAFISFTNVSTHPLRSAARIELRDEGGHLYAPLPLPASNRYAYSARTIRPRTRIPVQGSPADANLAAGGELVLFRIPARTYSNGDELELVIHQPGTPSITASLIV